jgi:hypothetical protein
VIPPAGHENIHAAQHFQAIEGATQTGQLEKRHTSNRAYCVRAYSRKSMSWIPPRTAQGHQDRLHQRLLKEGREGAFAHVAHLLDQSRKRSASLLDPGPAPWSHSRSGFHASIPARAARLRRLVEQEGDGDRPQHVAHQ